MNNALSILIPTYDYNAWPLVEALAAQARRLPGRVEIIVFDDGSQVHYDDHNKINSLPNASYRHFEKNSGRSTIRRKLAEQASSEWLLFLDSDTLPASEDFLEKYLQQISADYHAVCGGIAYEDDGRSGLRYRYGKEREAIPAPGRAERPYMVFTGNLLVRKEIFLEISRGLPDFYGEDLLISDRVRKKGYNVLHIDNPVIHLGLENSESYLEKVKEMVSEIAMLEKKEMISNDLMRLQVKYHWLRKRGMLGTALWYFQTFEKGILNNLNSRRPNLKNLDLYKLFHYHQSLKNG